MSNYSPTIKQLEALYWTAKLGSYQAAADKLFTTQSAISKRLSELEVLFNARFFDRQAKKSNVLTAMGRQLFAHAEEVLHATSKLVQAMSPQSEFRGMVRIASLDMFAATWLPGLIDYLRLQHPTAQIELEIDATESNLDKLRRGHVDLAFSPVPVNDAQHHNHELGSMQFSWMASPEMPLTRTHLTPQELFALPQIMHSSQKHLIPRADRLTDNCHTITANTYSLLLQLTLSGHGVCYLPTAYLQHELEAGRLLALNVEDMPTQLHFFAVYRNDVAHPLMEQIVGEARRCFTLAMASAGQLPLTTLPLMGPAQPAHMH